MIKYNISSYNAEKHINNLSKKITLKKINTNSDNIEIHINYFDKNYIESYFKKHAIIVNDKKYYRISNALRRFTSIGLLTGIILCFVLYLISNIFISRIVIKGNDFISNQFIMELLIDNNINIPCLKEKIDYLSIEKKLLDNEKISAVSVITKGTTLIINIKEKLLNSEYINIGKFEPITSIYDCKITKINIIQGTSKLKIGDVVKVGDVLVEPYTISDDKMLQVQPIAEIFGDVWITAHLDIKDTTISYERTGKKTTSSELFLGNMLISAKDKKHNYEFFEQEIQNVRITNMFLPFYQKKCIIYETKKVVNNSDFENNKMNYIKQCREISLLNFKEYDIIKEESYLCEKKDNSNIISYTITINRRIS